MRLERHMEDVLKVRVVQVREDPEEVLVDVFGGVGEGGGEIAACTQRGSQHVSGASSSRRALNSPGELDPS